MDASSNSDVPPGVPSVRAVPQRPTYNPIFERFIPQGKNDDQINGLVAYGLYKIAKREWASAIWEKEKRSPSEQELQAYIASWTKTRLDGLEEQSNNALASFSEVVIENERPNILKDALRGSNTKNILTSMAANFFYTLMLIGFVLVVAWSGVDILGFFEKLKPPVR